MNIDESVKFIAGALQEYSSTMPPTVRDSFTTIAIGHLNNLVHAASIKAAPAQDAQAQPQAKDSAKAAPKAK